MSRFQGYRVAGWVLAVLGTMPVVAQGAAKTRAVVWRQKAINFSDEKALMGLPVGGKRSRTQCSSDGVTFFGLTTDSEAADSSAAPELYSVSASGEVKHLRRKMPADFNVAVYDFFAADVTLATLMEAEKREDGQARDVRYFLSLSDHDGDGAKLVPLDVRFKPLKIAVFGTGDFMVLGWDEVNLLPVLAVLKEDGTVRRFLDLDTRRSESARDAHAYDSLQEAASSDRARTTLKTLQSAAFVPFGSEVLLTFPGTAKGIRVLSAVGEDRTIPIALPPGFLLHDVLVSGARWTLVVRAQAAEDFAKTDTVVEHPRQRLFEVSSNNGSLLREFVFAKPAMGDVVCAANGALTAIFEDAVAEDKAGVSTELVVSTVLR